MSPMKKNDLLFQISTTMKKKRKENTEDNQVERWLTWIYKEESLLQHPDELPRSVNK
jgi:hypothetical protein